MLHIVRRSKNWIQYPRNPTGPGRGAALFYISASPPVEPPLSPAHPFSGPALPRPASPGPPRNPAETPLLRQCLLPPCAMARPDPLGPPDVCAAPPPKCPQAPQAAKGRPPAGPVFQETGGEIQTEQNRPYRSLRGCRIFRCDARFLPGAPSCRPLFSRPAFHVTLRDPDPAFAAAPPAAPAAGALRSSTPGSGQLPSWRGSGPPPGSPRPPRSR